MFQNTTKKATYRLSFDDAINIWLMRWKGEHQHKIAARFDINQGRINEVLKEKRHVGSKAAAEKLRELNTKH